MLTLKHSRYSRMGFIVFVSLLLSGCVWWRLLRTKNHLADFRSNFSFSLTDKDDASAGYSLHFKKPLLSGDDILYITFAPNERRTSATGEVWAYLFEKKSNRAVAPMHIYLHFMSDKLAKIVFPKTFATLLSPEQFAIIATALGKASVTKSKRIVDAEVPVASGGFLSRSHIKTILGRADQSGREELGKYLLYRYHLRGKIKHVWVKLYFDNRQRCIKMQTHLAGGLVNIHFKE